MPELFINQPAVQDLRAIRADHFLLTINVLDSDSLPYDFTGHSATMQVRRTTDGEQVYLEFSSLDGSIVLNPGQIVISMVTSDIQATVELDFVYDLEITKPGDLPYTWMKGTLKFDPDVTKPPVIP